MEIELELGGIEIEIKIKRWQGLVTAAGLALVGAAVAQELARPAAERTWHGHIAGFIPYDFRLPTVERIKEAYWNPSNPQIFTDRTFGVGWGVNLARLIPGQAA